MTFVLGSILLFFFKPNIFVVNNQFNLSNFFIFNFEFILSHRMFFILYC